MYHHVKKLMFTVRVDEPDPRFGNMLLEQFGGANGELAAAMQRIGELSMEVELLRARIGRPGPLARRRSR